MKDTEKILLIELLLKLVQEEEVYKQEYKESLDKIDAKRKNDEEIKWNDPLYNYYWTHRTPSDANIKDASRIIGRLGFRMANGKKNM